MLIPFDRFGNNPNLCSNGDSCPSRKNKSKSMIAVYIAVPIAVLAVIGILTLVVFFYMRRKRGDTLALTQINRSP